MSMLSAVRQNSLGLGLFAVITAGVIALTQAATRDKIAYNREQAQARALYQIVPPGEIDNDLLKDTLTITDSSRLGFQAPINAYIARRNGQAITVILPAIAPDGYTGKIDLIVGIRADATLAGVRVLAHKETPGLGDKVDLKKSNWILSFNDERLNGANDPTWGVKKDGGRFDQFTGATITPRAIVNAVKGALIYFQEHRTELLTPRQPQDLSQPQIPSQPQALSQPQAEESNHG